MLTFEEWTSWLMYQQLFASRGQQGGGQEQGTSNINQEPGPFLFSMRGIGMLFLSPLNRKMQMAFGLNPGMKAITAGHQGTNAPRGKLKRRKSDPTLHSTEYPSSSNNRTKQKSPPKRRSPVKRGDSKTADDLDLLAGSTDTDESDTESDYNHMSPPSPPRGTRFVPLGVINPEEGFVPIVIKSGEMEQPFPNEPVENPEVKQVVPVHSKYSRIRAEHFGPRPGGAQFGYSPFGRPRSSGRVNFASMCSAVNDAFQTQRETEAQFSTQKGQGDGRWAAKSSAFTQPREHLIPAESRESRNVQPADMDFNHLREENDSGYWDVGQGQDSNISTREPSPLFTSSPAVTQSRSGITPRFQPPPGQGFPSQRLPAFGGLPTFGPRTLPGFGGIQSDIHHSFHSQEKSDGSSPVDIPFTNGTVTIQEIPSSPAGSETTLVGSPAAQSVMSTFEYESEFSPKPHVRKDTLKPERSVSTKNRRKTPVEGFAHPDIPGATFGGSPVRTRGLSQLSGFLGSSRQMMFGRHMSAQPSVPNGHVDTVDFPSSSSLDNKSPAVTSDVLPDPDSVVKTEASQPLDTPLYADTSFQASSSPVILSPDGSVDSQALVPLTQELSLAMKSHNSEAQAIPKVALDPNVEADMTVAVREAAGTLEISTSEPWVLCAAVPKTSEASAVKDAVERGAIIALPASQAATAMKDMDVSTDGSDSGGLSFMVDEDTQTLADEDLFSFYELEMQDYQKHPDWMSKLPEKMHHVPITTLAIPGSHISLAIEGDMRTDMDFSKCNLEMLDILTKLPDFAIFNAFRKQMKRVWKSWMPKQVLSVIQQLEAGSRYLDIQLAKFRKHYYGEHGLYTREFQDYLLQLKAFLEANPKEIVIVHFKKLESYTRKDKRQLLTDLFQMFGRKLCSTDFTDRFTLSSLWAAHKQLVLIFPKADIDLFKGHIFDRFVFKDDILFMSRVPKKQVVEDLVEDLDEDYEDLEDEKDAGRRFHLMYAVISPDLNMVFGEYKHKCMGDLTLQETSPSLCKWVEDKTSLNVVVLDFIGGGDIVKSVIDVNKKK